jgi:hypothetical protein
MINLLIVGQTPTGGWCECLRHFRVTADNGIAYIPLTYPWQILDQLEKWRTWDAIEDTEYYSASLWYVRSNFPFDPGVNNARHDEAH